jgi:hypothetical protein
MFSVQAITDDVMAVTEDLDTVGPPFDGGPTVSLRWILLHLLEENECPRAGGVASRRVQVTGTLRSFNS